MRLFRSHSDPYAPAVADRLRSVLAGHRLASVAEEFGLPVRSLGELLDGTRSPQVAFLLDVVAALVHRWGIDPEWLLTGEYNGELHRQALLLGEDRSIGGVRAVRELVEHEYRALPGARILSLPSFRDIIPPRAAG